MFFLTKFTILQKKPDILFVKMWCVFIIFQMQECLDKLRNPPITTQTQIVNHDHMEYPAVTFCFKNSAGQGYDLRTLRVINSNLFFYFYCLEIRFQYFNISDYWINFDSAHLYKSPWEGFDWGGTDLSTVWEYATYRCSGKHFSYLEYGEQVFLFFQIPQRLQ